MARKGMAGQLNMFDFYSSLDTGAPGEVEMVSLVPDFEEEPEPESVDETPVVEEEPVVETKSMVRQEVSVAMSRSYEVDGVKIEIAYINYNKVRITKGDEAPIIKEFASTKEAVDYYVERMQELELDE